MAKSKAKESNKYENWSTPQGLFDELNKRYHFEVDVCASPENAKCPKFFTKNEDGLKQKWEGICWCNPPYNDRIGLWVEKGYKSSIMGAVVVCFVPAKTRAKWWLDFGKKGKISHLKRDSKLADYLDSVPYSSAVITFYPPRIPHFGVFRYYDLLHEVNVWGLNRIPVMAPWLLPQLTDDIVKTVKAWNKSQLPYK